MGLDTVDDRIKEHLQRLNRYHLELLEMRGTSIEDFRKDPIQPLICAGLLEMTDPANPKSPKQKYRITKKGRQILEKRQ